MLNNSQVIACTLTGAASDDVHRLPAAFFDLVVIDECAQALESACWIALLRYGVLRAEREGHRVKENVCKRISDSTEKEREKQIVCDNISKKFIHFSRLTNRVSSILYDFC